MGRCLQAVRGMSVWAASRHVSLSALVLWDSPPLCAMNSPPQCWREPPAPAATCRRTRPPAPPCSCLRCSTEHTRNSPHAVSVDARRRKSRRHACLWRVPPSKRPCGRNKRKNEKGSAFRSCSIFNAETMTKCLWLSTLCEKFKQVLKYWFWRTCTFQFCENVYFDSTTFVLQLLIFTFHLIENTQTLKWNWIRLKLFSHLPLVLSGH